MALESSLKSGKQRERSSAFHVLATIRLYSYSLALPGSTELHRSANHAALGPGHEKLLGMWHECECIDSDTCEFTDEWQCHPCVEATQFACKRCNGGYCIIHNEGSTLELVGVQSGVPFIPARVLTPNSSAIVR